MRFLWAEKNVVVALTLVALVGCAKSNLDSARESNNLTHDLFVTAFNDMEAVYIRDPDIQKIAIVSLKNLSDLDPSLTISRDDNELKLIRNKIILARYPIRDNFSPTEWGETTGQILDEAMRESPLIKAVAAEKLFTTMLGPAVKILDPFSSYASAEIATENRASREGFGGIGVRISVEDDIVRVTSVVHYTPAERMGLKQGDIILAIDGVTTKGLSQQEVVNRLRGPIDSKLLVTVKRPATQPELQKEFAIVLTRAHVVPETVTYHKEGRIAYFRIYSFNSETTESLKRAFANIKAEKGPSLLGLILDLRGNPGGLLNQSASLADLFLRDGRIVSTHGRHPESHQFFDAGGEDITNGLPIVVLIDGNSASAAEIVSAALQDNGRAVIVGSNSFGKGTVQTVLPLPNEGEITLTWARFHAPSGYTLHGLGVLPNICTSNRASADQVMAGLDSGTLPIVPVTERNAAGIDDEAAHQKLRGLCPAETAEKEIDLEVARRLLERPVLFNAALELTNPLLNAPNEAKRGLDHQNISIQ